MSRNYQKKAVAAGEEPLPSELSYRRLFEAAKDGILILDAKTGRVHDVNPFLSDLLCFPRSEMLGKTVGELSPFEDLVSNQAMLERLQEQGYVRYEDLPLETKDGRNIAVEFVSHVHESGGRKVIQCNICDITDRAELKQRLALLHTCVSNLNEIVLITEAKPVGDAGLKIVFVNEAFERITGYSLVEAVGRSPYFLLGKKTNRRVLREVEQALIEQRPIRRQILHYRKDGTAFWLDMDIVPIRDTAGKCTYFAAIARDISEEKRREEQLLWRTALFEAQVHSDFDGMLIVDHNGKKILQNQRLLDLLDLPRRSIDPADDEGELEWMIKRLKNPGQFLEKIAYLEENPNEISHDEAELMEGKFFERYSSPVRGKDGKDYGRIWSFRDITDRKRSEEKIVEQAAFLDKARDAILVRGLDGKILFWNKGAERIYGWTRQEVLGHNIDGLLYADPESFEEINRVMLSKGEWYGELNHRTKNDRELTIEARWTLIRDNEGQPKSMLAINTDITEKKKMETQFMRAQRMESIGTLAGGIAHDLNNILTPILMAIHLLKMGISDGRTPDILDTIEASAKRGADIVRQVLSFARGQETDRIEIEARHLLNEVECLVRDTFPKDIRLNFSIADDTGTIFADPTQVHQILLNLCVNARDAMPGGGSLTVRVENCVLEEQYATMNLQARAGPYVNIRVADTGTGIPPELVDKIFEPFHTTKALNKGTGLGLSTVLALVRSHEGIVKVSSEPGKGSIFNVYLPAIAISETRKKRPVESSLPRGKGETILVVDDEASILAITSQTLEALGYQVFTASNGAEAVEVYREHRNEIDVVLTDMKMPVMDGWAEIEALTKINPAVKIIAASGHMAGGQMTEAANPPTGNFLMKPYTAAGLIHAIRAVLDES